MNSAVERLLSLRVKDVMHDNVLTVDRDANMGAAARKLLSSDVTGAPVVDEQGRCVGVLSASDFIACEADEPQREMLVRNRPDEPYRAEMLRDHSVESHMTPFVQTVSAETPILHAGRIMCGEHIHRLIVVDEQHRPVGVVSSLDLVAATVAAVEE